MKREKNNNKNNNLETIILAERIQKVEEVTRRREKNAYGKSDRAITLIALVVTIIVLLILAGVTMNNIAGADGIIKKSKDVATEHKNDAEEKDTTLRNLENNTDNYIYKPQENYLKAGEYATNTDMYSDDEKHLAVIPAGFTVSGFKDENKINSGLVIYKGDLSKANWTTGKDASGKYIKRTYNQYVWIPCTEEDYKRTEWGVEEDYGTRASKDETTLGSVTLSDFDKGNGITNDILNEIVKQISSEKNSVKKYSGFYIGRYEVGVGNVIAQYKEPSASLKWSEAYKNAKKIDVGSASVSYLSSSYARDTALNFIQNNSEFKKYASKRDNGSNGTDINENWQDKSVTYKDANGNLQTKAALTRTRLQTGVTTAKCNIFDMGGNVAEFTTELNPFSNGDKFATVVLRGSEYFGTEEWTGPAGYRWDEHSGGVYDTMGFRTTLFIK